MNKLLQLQQERSHKALTAKEIFDKAEKAGRPMSAEEIAVFDRLMSEVAGLEAQIAAIQDTLKRGEDLKALNDKLTQSGGRVTQPDRPADPQNAGATFRVPPSARRTGRLKAFGKGERARERAYRAGMWARATLFRDERALSWCLSNGVGTDLRNALGTNPNSGGGFLVPEEMSEAIIDLREKYGVFRKETRVVPMGRDTLTVPRRLSGVSIGPIGENPSAAPSASTPKWNQVRLTAKKAGGLVLMSTEIAEDAVIDLADYVAEEFAYGFSLFEDQCGFIGDGTSTYLGINGLGNIFTAAGGLAGAVDGASGHDTFEEIDATDLARVMAKLPAYARMNAKWYVSAVGYDLVFGRIMANAGGNTIRDLEGGYTPRYLGYPIVISQVLPTATTDLSDLPMLYFGDLSLASTMGDRREVRVFPSEHRYMDTDQIGILGTERIDIVNHDVGTTSAAGPVVALVGE